MLPAFDSHVAWDLGATIRAQCQRTQSLPAAISIVHANSQLLFFARTGPGTTPNEMEWVKRNEATVKQWGVSTLHLKLEDQEVITYTPNEPRREYALVDRKVDWLHGGGFPVRVRNVEGAVGVIVVSGLKGEDNHAAIVGGIQEYLARDRPTRFTAELD